jgi:hypothetical protein
MFTRTQPSDVPVTWRAVQAVVEAGAGLEEKRESRVKR